MKDDISQSFLFTDLEPKPVKKSSGAFGLKYEEKYTATAGDIWQIGQHRLMCGCSTDLLSVEKLCEGGKVQLVHTDPPYNVKVSPSGTWENEGHDGRWGKHREKGGTNVPKENAPAAKIRGRKVADPSIPKGRKLEGDFVSDYQFQRLLHNWFCNFAFSLEKGRSFYIWGGFSNIANYPPRISEAGLFFHQAIIWVKNSPVLTRLDFMGKHEICFYGWKPGAPHKFLGPNNIPDVWFVDKVPSQHMVHLTEKPVEIPRMAIEYSTAPGEKVLDLFGGSGSTLVAAEETGRIAYLMEIDVTYCNVILARCNFMNMDIRKVA